MHKDGKKLLRLMFRDDEDICVSDSQFSTHSLPLETVLTNDVTLISPNPAVPSKVVDNSSLIFVALNPIKGFRSDKNCYKYRNFLIELDSSTKEMQIAYLKKVGIPLSAMVWSGSKSIHALISLTGDGLSAEKAYRTTYKWILNIVTMADQALGNPSRSIRLAGAIRPETGNEQQLVEFNGPVTSEELGAWLQKYPGSRPKDRPKRKPSGEADISQLRPDFAKMLKNGFPAGLGRNQGWFQIACELYMLGINEDNAIDFLQQYFNEDHDFREKEWLTAIRSAFKYKSEE